MGATLRAHSSPGSIHLRTIYLLRASLLHVRHELGDRADPIRNVSGAPISKVNLSVLPHAFGELVWIGNCRVDGRVVSAVWTNNSNLAVQLGRRRRNERFFAGLRGASEAVATADERQVSGR